MTVQIPEELSVAVDAQAGGPVVMDGGSEQYVIMSGKRYREILGISSEADFADSVAAVLRGYADLQAGRVKPLAEVMDSLGGRSNGRNSHWATSDESKPLVAVR